MDPPPVLSPHEVAYRLARVAAVKEQTPIAIYGSFYRERKQDLLLLRDYLRDPSLGYSARISEDLDTVTPGQRSPVRDREASELLIRKSDIHIFVMPRRREGEPDTLLQSVSMELERLNTLIECGAKRDQQVAVFSSAGLWRPPGGALGRYAGGSSSVRMKSGRLASSGRSRISSRRRGPSAGRP
ncbi:MAG: hypothetical protein M0P22_00680 [Methanoculleus sp.]|nr:hypothetical protein [Methanoculleus sp.]